MEIGYSKDITDRFLIKYRELEGLQTNDTEKYQYLLSKYRAELDLFRRMRNDLSHNAIGEAYPFAVSSACLEALESILQEVKEKAYPYAKKGEDIVFVTPDTEMKEVFKRMSEFHYSYLPLLSSDGRVCGIISSDSVLDLIHKERGRETFSERKVADFSEYFSLEANDQAFFIFIDKNLYFYQLTELLKRYYHDERKLGILFVTEHGRKEEPLIGILTPWDILKNSN